MRLYVEDQEICTYAFQEDEEYGSWEDQFSYVVRGVSTKRKNSWDDAFEVEPDSSGQVYVLAIEYGSGDSFGNASGRGEVVYMFPSRELAEKAKKSLDEDRDSFSKTIDIGGGKSFTYADPSVGYFESLECTTIHTFKVA